MAAKTKPAKAIELRKLQLSVIHHSRQIQSGSLST